MAVVLKTEDIVKEYPGVRALKGVSLSVESGRILGLVGENGAGKSTLIRILGGIEQPTSGVVNVRGTDRVFSSAKGSQAAGISVVSQEFKLVSELSVSDNIYLGREKTSFGVVDEARTTAEVRSLLAELGLDIDPDQPIASLTVSDRQLVEIARALSQDSGILIMDEPTAALNDVDIERLHGIVRRLAESGKAVIYVSHHLSEVFQLCDEVAVLRDGVLVSTQPTSDITEDQLVTQMLGREATPFLRSDQLQESRPVALRVRDVRIGAFPAPFSVEVFEGEVLGLAGLAGSGRSELTRAIFGDLPARGGTVEVGGRPVRLGSVKRAMSAGIFMLSEDRKSEGILPHLSVIENSMVARDKRSLSLAKRLLPSVSDERAEFSGLRSQMSIKVANGRQLIGSLSGGNQQKVLFGRAVQSGCRVLLLNEPTRGVDVGAKVEIYELIRQLSAQGVSVVVSSSDVPELESVCDRCVVYFAGQQVDELVGEELTQDNIVRASVGQGAMRHE